MMLLANRNIVRSVSDCSVLSESRNLRALPNLTGARALEVLRVDRAGLEDTPYALCESCPKLKSL